MPTTKTAKRLPEHTKYARLVHHIREEIISGKLRPHEKLPSTRVLANVHEVSAITARRCLVELATAGLTYTRRGLGTFVAESQLTKSQRRNSKELTNFCLLGYRPSRPTSQSNYACLYRALHRESQKRGVSVTEANVEDVNRLGGPAAFLRSNGCQGFILFGIINQPFIQSVLSETPTVLLDTRIETNGADCVVVDNVPLTYQLTRHLLDLGHKRIMFLGAGRSDVVGGRRVVDPDTYERMAGFTMAMEEARIKVPSDWIIASYGIEDGEREEMIDRVLSLDPRPTAILCCSAGMARRMKTRCQIQGCLVPRDMSLVTFSMNPSSLKAKHAITCGYVDPNEMAGHAIDCLKLRSYRKETRSVKMSVPGQLFDGKSTSAPPV